MSFGIRRFPALRMAMPVRLKPFYKEYGNCSFRLLDVGCGNHSPSVTLKWFPQCEYFGLDRELYNNDEADLRLMSGFYKTDLAKEETILEAIPEGYFDVVLMTHVIEHLPNGLEVLAVLARKVAPGGKLYVETPSRQSLRLPSMYGTLNFWDDVTHVRIYDVDEIAGALERAGLEIVSAGPRRDLPRIALMPVKMCYDLLKYGRVRASAFWDLVGFASFVYARRK